MKRALLWLTALLPLLLFALLFFCEGYRLPLPQGAMLRATVVLCLTSTPQRLADPWIQENILRMQTLYGFDEVVLSLPWTFKRTGEAYIVPPALAAASNLRILRCDDDGPATKLLAPLRESGIPETHIIVVADDDMEYKENAFVALIEAVQEHPMAVHTMCRKEIQGNLGFGAYKKTFLPLLSIPRPAACERVDDDFFTAAFQRLGVPLKRATVDGCLSVCRACVYDFPSATKRLLTDKTGLFWEDFLTSDRRRTNAKQCVQELGEL